MSEQEQNKTVGDFPPVTSGNIPIGTVMMYAGLLEGGGEDYLDQQGWMVCDGRLLDQDKYKELYQVLRSSYGVGGAKFYIPDCRGMFVRGVDPESHWDKNATDRHEQNPGGNTGAEVGTRQGDEFKSHHHKIKLWEEGYSYNNKVSGGSGGSSYNDDKDKGPYTYESGGSETRPKNIYMYYIIKFKTVENN